jgi:hypothetical protein
MSIEDEIRHHLPSCRCSQCVEFRKISSGRQIRAQEQREKMRQAVREDGMKPPTQAELEEIDRVKRGWDEKAWEIEEQIRQEDIRMLKRDRIRLVKDDDPDDPDHIATVRLKPR